jgi:hypothetical protein
LGPRHVRPLLFLTDLTCSRVYWCCVVSCIQRAMRAVSYVNPNGGIAIQNLRMKVWSTCLFRVNNFILTSSFVYFMFFIDGWLPPGWSIHRAHTFSATHSLYGRREDGAW